MSAYKEIVTKAVIGKGKKYYRNTYSLNVENTPTTVLGCWVINHVMVSSDNFYFYFSKQNFNKTEFQKLT